MGTSSSFRGAGSSTPLLPTWADPPVGIPQPSLTLPQPGSQVLLSDVAGPALPKRPDIVPDLQGPRFRAPRVNFTHYVASSGTDRRSLGRALSGHIRSVSGGTRTATRRMYPSRRAASNLLGVLHDIRDNGIEKTLQSLNLGRLTGRPPKEILVALTDVVCASGGPIGEAIAREAYIETIAEMMEESVDLDHLADTQIAAIVISFISRSIATRVIEDIGQKLDVTAVSPEQADMLSEDLYDFIRGAVKDELSQELEQTRSIEKADLSESIGKIYQVAFGLIEAEANVII